jgi:hypothetical protein
VWQTKKTEMNPVTEAEATQCACPFACTSHGWSNCQASRRIAWEFTRGNVRGRCLLITAARPAVVRRRPLASFHEPSVISHRGGQTDGAARPQ